jgi:hypothetical protein
MGIHINENPSGTGSLCDGVVGVKLYVNYKGETTLQLEDKDSMQYGQVLITGAGELQAFAEGILEYLKAVEQ